MTPRAYATILAWAARESHRALPCLQLLHMVEPAPGVRLLCLPVARRGFHGAYLHAGRTSKRTAWWLDRLAHGGYAVSSEPTSSCGIALLRNYLALSFTPRQESAA